MIHDGIFIKRFLHFVGKLQAFLGELLFAVDFLQDLCSLAQ